KTPITCVTSFMQDIKNPMIRQKSIDSMLGKGLINKRFTDNSKEVYLISDAGLAAAGNTVQREATPSNAPQQHATPTEEPKRETKQSAINALLEREEGATLEQLKKATGWQAHSVRGHLSNMRRKKQIDIDVWLNSDGNRVYQIAKEA
ncbi:MAG: DUF3489 domain-containing protein, partial [Alphaproteobacteria bacterium]|nr:DUF3489 domain-containing protein [Alphaproteobacteria bacterium]